MYSYWVKDVLCLSKYNVLFHYKDSICICRTYILANAKQMGGSWAVTFWCEVSILIIAVPGNCHRLGYIHEESLHLFSVF